MTLSVLLIVAFLIHFRWTCLHQFSRAFQNKIFFKFVFQYSLVCATNGSSRKQWIEFQVLPVLPLDPSRIHCLFHSHFIHPHSLVPVFIIRQTPAAISLHYANVKLLSLVISWEIFLFTYLQTSPDLCFGNNFIFLYFSSPSHYLTISQNFNTTESKDKTMKWNDSATI